MVRRGDTVASKYFLTLFTLILLLLSSSALGQDGDYPKIEVFGGFSYLSADLGTRENFFGWQVSLSGNVKENIAIVVDAGGQYKSVSGIGLSYYEFLLGPRFMVRGERVTGFVHALAGGRSVFVPSDIDSAFALGLGGGMDVSVSDSIGIRVFQFDYMPSHSRGMWSHDARFGSGIVFKWTY